MHGKVFEQLCYGNYQFGILNDECQRNYVKNKIRVEFVIRDI